MVSDGPEKYGFDSGVWNSPMIAEVIRLEFKVRYNPRYLCRLLKKLGLSFQKAAFDAERTEADEKKRKEQLEIKQPEILKKAEVTNAVILFADEVTFAQQGRFQVPGLLSDNNSKLKPKVKEKD
ncbi:winged helix-turn-helix domain-containing protein [Desulfococcaceae bacterium HSG9]|nr:winged helix-turn-helix domain-containing protein [Desulfococcaceae bacterium HSG9]